MYPTKIHPLAASDIKEGALWYNILQERLGRRFTKAVRQKVASIKTNPLAFSIKYHNVRTAVVDKFPFLIHFTFEDNTILIIAVLHTSRNPDNWYKR